MADQSTAAADSPQKTLARLLRLGRPYWVWYILLVLGTAVQSGLDVALMEAIRRMINAATEHSYELLKSGSLIGLSVLLGSEVVAFFVSYFGELLDHVSVMGLQTRLVDKVTRVKLGVLQTYHSADLIARITDSASAAQAGLNSKARQVLHQLLSIVFLLGYLVHLDFALSVGTLALSVLMPAIVIPLSKAIRETYKQLHQAYARKDSFIQDSVQGAEVVRAFSLSSRLKRKFGDMYRDILGHNRKVLLLNLAISNSQFGVAVGGILFVLGYGGLQVSRGVLDLGSVVVFLFCFERVAFPLSQLVRTWPELQNAIVQAGRAFEILDLPEDEYEVHADASRSGGAVVGEAVVGRATTADAVAAGGTAMANVDLNSMVRDNGEARIEFANVHFSYDGGQEILRGISLVAEAGKMTALVGPSGSGKSTLLKLLLRLYEPSSGRILCHGVPIDSMTVGNWRGLTAYVSQDPHLFSGTLIENIRYGRLDASEDEVIAAAEAANIHDFIQSTPDGYQTKIGERGIRLSGGQRQRLAIARAVLKNPLILVLDEPTSSLDSESELAVQQALNRLMAGRTTLVVAHRLSTVRDAHRIAYLEDGVVQEFGTHEELIASRGRYFRMHEVLLHGDGSEERATQVDGLRSLVDSVKGPEEVIA